MAAFNDFENNGFEYDTYDNFNDYDSEPESEEIEEVEDIRDIIDKEIKLLEHSRSTFIFEYNNEEYKGIPMAKINDDKYVFLVNVKC